METRIPLQGDPTGPDSFLIPAPALTAAVKADARTEVSFARKGSKGQRELRLTTVCGGMQVETLSDREDLDLEVSGVEGFSYLILRGGGARMSGNAGEVELDLDDVELEVAGSGGAFRLQARGGKAEINGLEAGGEINLEETPATL